MEGQRAIVCVLATLRSRPLMCLRVNITIDDVQRELFQVSLMLPCVCSMQLADDLTKRLRRLFLCFTQRHCVRAVVTSALCARRYAACSSASAQRVIA